MLIVLKCGLIAKLKNKYQELFLPITLLNSNASYANNHSQQKLLMQENKLKCFKYKSHLSLTWSYKTSMKENNQNNKDACI